MDKQRKHPIRDVEVKRKFTIKDIEMLAQAFEETYGVRDDAALKLFKEIVSIYRRHMEGQANKNLDLSLMENRPKVPREELIRRYQHKEPDLGSIEEFKSNKGSVNIILKKLMMPKEGRILNPKFLLIKKSKRSEGDLSNYFVAVEPPQTAEKEEPAAPVAVSPVAQLFATYMEKWKKLDYSGEFALPSIDLQHVEKELDFAKLDKESLAYLLISAVFRRRNYEFWWEKNKDNVRAVWHLLNLLTQKYRYPFWLSAFILQYADQTLLSQAVSEFPAGVLESEEIKAVMGHIENKTVEEYLRECTAKQSPMVGSYGDELLLKMAVFKNRMAMAAH